VSSRLIPKGYSDYIPSEARAQSQLLHSLTTCYEDNGFSPIATPTVELTSSLEVGMDPTLLKRAVKFFDAHGQLVTLRPDNTTPIARIVASRMASDPLPLRLYYHSPIFRQCTEHGDTDIETFQSGLEYIGDPSMNAEAYVLKTCIESLTQSGLTCFHVDIGHTDFINGLSSDKKNALLKGDYLTLGEIPARGAIDIVDGHKNLNQLHETLVEYQLGDFITYNKGLVKGIHYYTGTLFEIYTQDTKQIIASGGRYDTLLNKFGYDQPAVGIALNLTRLQEYLT
jgi:ATP phosphoribosyltransferase regulatory subunit